MVREGGLKPEGLCDDAWIPLERFAFAMAHGVSEFFTDLIRIPDTTINCCNDGIRPVIFKCKAMSNTENE
jgi:uncharacterized repeat protein (TIGR04076 family)